MLLFSFCECHWIIPWILPFLLGLLLGWLLFSSVRKRLQELEVANGQLKSKISDLEGDLSDCKAKRAALDSELTLLKGTIREQQQAISQSKVETKSGSISADSGSISADSGGIAAPLGVVSGMAAATVPKSGSKNIYAVLAADNLQVVEGIGPKMDEVLKKQGIQNWSQLGASNAQALRALLDKVNQKRYRIIDPSTWPKQASMAESGDWEGLISYQKNLDSAKTKKGSKQTDSKVEKLLIKMGAMKRWKADDLKAVEGIGPKIEGLMKAAGINTWRKLSTSKVETLKKILEEAGPRYRLADPTSWPKQAEMAADGRWDDLDEYQDFLQGESNRYSWYI